MPDFQVPVDDTPAPAQNQIAPVYVDGITLEDLQNLLAASTSMTTARGGDSDIEFWASISRSAKGSGADILELTLDSPRMINEISFEVSRFPHTMAVFTQPDTSDNGLFMSSAQPLIGDDNVQCKASVTDSLPALIPPMPVGYLGHPQHFGAGHWVKRSWRATALVQKIWIVMIRIDNANVPVGPDYKPIPYSLGVRNLKFGMALNAKSDVPYTSRDQNSPTARAPFSTTTAIAGNAVDLAVRENRASNLLTPDGGVWQSEPQPISSAIVNFYVDARDAAGDPQVIDGFYLEPLVSGPTLNLYYTLDNPLPTADAPSSDEPITYPALQPHGGYSLNQYGIVLGPGIGYLDLDNRAAQWDPEKSWWMGLTITPGFDSATMSDSYTLLDTGDLSLVWNGSQRVLVFTYGHDTVADANLVFSAYTRISVTFGYSATTGMIYLFSEDRVLASAPIHSTGLDRPTFPDLTGMDGSAVRIGGVLALDPGGSNMRLEGLILKPEEPPLATDEISFGDNGEQPHQIQTAPEWNTYLNDPGSYIVGTPGQPGDPSVNAILRFAPAFMSAGVEQDALNPYGFVGGSANNFENLTWTPVASDYRLAKGNLRFLPTQAAAFKFEFTNLTAMPYDDYRPALREVKVWPGQTSLTGSGSSAPSPTGITTLASQTTTPDSRTGALGDSRVVAGVSASTTTFSDQGGLYVNNTPLVPSPTYQPTTAVYSSDPIVAARLRGQGIVYNNLQPWQAPSTPSVGFAAQSVHYYETVTVSHTQRVAFFVGLNAIRMFRADYTAAHDTDQWVEPFLDMLHIDNGHEVSDNKTLALNSPANGWSVRPGGGLVAPTETEAGIPMPCQSVPYRTAHRITAIQFATQQSNPQQLIADPNFYDTSLADWEPVGDARISPSSESITGLEGNLAVVQRNSSISLWSTIEANFASWDDIAAQGLTWDQMGFSQNAPSPLGGIASPLINSVVNQGRMYAAARVYAPIALSQPLSLEILDEDDNVVASADQVIQAGQINEWYCSYEVQPAEGVGRTWDEVAALGTWDQVAAQGLWADVSQSMVNATTNYRVRVVQHSSTDETWQVDNISLFIDPLLWEFSIDRGNTWVPGYDVRNNPSGVLTFPPPDSYTYGKTLQWRVASSTPNAPEHAPATRPWYDVAPKGVPVLDTMQSAPGPNMTPQDIYPPIWQDPRWQTMRTPIPVEWWYSFKVWLAGQGINLTQPRIDVVALPQSIIPVNETPTPIESEYTDG